MDVAAILNVHANPELVFDTLDSIMHYMTRDVLVVIDGTSTEFDFLALPVAKIRGFPHGLRKAPYRNVALGLKFLAETYPKASWYCYIEYDCLVASDHFRQSLEQADRKDVWMMGNDGRVETVDIPFVTSILGRTLTNHYYLLGCCQFMSNRFIGRLVEIDFFDKFLACTSDMPTGELLGYAGYDVSEHLYPSLARHFGGNIGVFATFSPDRWHGNYQVYPMRFWPELNPATENFPEASIMHPIKELDSPIRVHHREKRRRACTNPRQ